MLKLIAIAAAMLLTSLSVASAAGARSTAFYNTHTYVVNPNSGPAKVVPKVGVQRNPAMRRQWVR
jgi:hypothetical protein